MKNTLVIIAIALLSFMLGYLLRISDINVANIPMVRNDDSELPAVLLSLMESQTANSFAMPTENSSSHKAAQSRLGKIKDRLATLYPEAAEKRQKQLNEEIEKRLLYDLLPRLIEDDVRSAALMLKDIPDEEAQHYFLIKIAQHWGESDPDEAFRWAQSLDGTQFATAMPHVATNYALHKPSELALFLITLEPGQLKEDLTTRLAHHWASRDPGAAFDWMSSLQDFDQMQQAYSLIMKEYAREEPLVVSEIIKELPDSDLKKNLTISCAVHLANVNLSQALRWAAELSDKALSDEAVQSIYEQSIANHPSAAIDYFLFNTTGSKQQTLVTKAVRSWAENDPQEACQKLLQLPSTHQAASAQAIFKKWFLKDETKAASWIENLPAGNLQNVAVTEAFHHFVRSKPSEAIRWLSSIPEATAQRELVRSFLKNTPNEAAAYRAIEYARISPEDKQYLIGAVRDFIAQSSELIVPVLE